jgi:eukaryotic translation initiation factor 2C
MGLLNRINYASSNGEIKGFGINVDGSFQNVEGRIIDAPAIKYKNGNDMPRNGVWRGKNFIETQMQPTKWAIINCDDRTNNQAVINLSKTILTEAGRQGMQLTNFTMNDCITINMMRARPGELEKIFGELSKAGYGLVFVIIIDRNDCYARVKQAAELRVGILTQCIKSNTVGRMNGQILANVLLKVNAKLGGKNHEVVERSYNSFNAVNSGVMFVGADVTHPSPDARDIPSVVGVAASHDQVGFRYNCAWRLQNPKEEMIQDLENILVDQLALYKQKNGSSPAKLMYYRDGVSDGQFGQVLDIELAAIRRALQRHYGPDQKKHAKVTFIVVQKRHHTRFFPTGKDSSDGGRNNNIPAGTVVDKDIVHPFQYQFFMASHAAIQGVTKPAKYCVLVNESKIPPDDLQAITYDLCHLFTRCNRSVSYPAPTYYAHLVAARGKVYTVGQRVDLMNLQREFANKRFAPNFVQRCPMFFV